MQNLALEHLDTCVLSTLNKLVSSAPISKADIEEVIKESSDSNDQHMLFAKTKDGRYVYAQIWPTKSHHKHGQAFVGSNESEVIQWGFTQKARDKWQLMF